MASSLVWTPWPVNARFRVLAAGIWTDVTRYVTRSGTQISFSTDTATAEGSVSLAAQDTTTMPIFETWQEWRIDNLTPRIGTTYERYLKAYCGDFESDPQAPIHTWVIHLVAGEVLLDKSPNQIIGPYDYPAGTADNVIIGDLITYAGLASEISTSPSVNHIFNIAADMTFQNCTVREALGQLQQNAPSGIEVPTWTMYYHQDDPPTHSDNWGWILTWFQSSLIAAYSVDLTDDPAESSTTAFYRGMKRLRRGLQVVNRQTAIGQDPDTGDPIVVTVNDSASQSYLGRILAGKPIMDTTALTSTALVTARAQLELDRWKDVLETLTGIQTLLPGLLTGPMRIRIKRTVEPGLDTYTPFLINKITLAWDAAGLPFNTLELGTSLPELGNSGVGWRGGVRQQNWGVVPPPVTSLHLVSSVYQLATRDVTLIIGWTDPLLGNLLHLFARAQARRVVGGVPGLWGNWQTVGPIPPGAQAAQFVGLPASVNTSSDYYEVNASVDVVNTGGRHSGFTGLTPFPKTAVPVVLAAPTGLSVTSGQEQGGGKGVRAWAVVAFTPPAGADQLQMEHFIDGGFHTPDGVEPGGQTTFATGNLLPNTYYTFWVRGLDLFGNPGVWATIRVLILPIPSGDGLPEIVGSHPDIVDPLGVAGFSSSTTGSGTITKSTTTVFGGVTSLAFAAATGTATVTTASPFQVQPGVGWDYHDTIGGSTNTHGAFSATVQYYGPTGSAVGSPVTLYSGVTPTTSTTVPVLKDGRAIPPAGATQAKVTRVFTGDGTANTAYMLPSGGFINPMIAAGDMIRGGANGLASRLPIGSPYQYLGVDGAGVSVQWATFFTTPGDLLFANGSVAPVPLPIGTEDYELRVVTGAPGWATPTPVTIPAVGAVAVDGGARSGVVYWCDTALSGGGALQVQLPDAALVPAGWQVGIVFSADTGTTGNTLDLLTGGAHQNILLVSGAAAALNLPTLGQSITLASNGADLWYVMAGYGL